MSKGKTVQKSEASVPQYQEDFYKKVYARSEAESNKPFVAFRGDMVADPNQAQNMAFSNALTGSNRANQFDPLGSMQGLVGQKFDVGRTKVGNADEYNGVQANRQSVRDVSPQQIMGVLGNYMNPYTQINIDQGVRDLNRARIKQLQSDQDAQIGRGAFGGSRGALLEAETNKNYNESVADFVDKKREDAFNVASNLASQDINRMLDADKFMAGQDSAFALQNAQLGQQAGLQNQQFDQQSLLRQADLDNAMNVANANIGNQMLARDQGIFNTILGQQNQMQQQLNQQGLIRNQYEQAELDAIRREFDREQNQGLRNLGVLQSGLSGISPLISTTGSSQKKTGFGDVLGAGLQVASLFSDSRLKKSIKFLFKLANGINIYSWEWNEKAKDLEIPEDYTVGVLAQEVMHIPNAVIRDESGYFKVNYGALR